jgi:dihydrofolate reductase
MTSDRVIGTGDGLPWHVPDEYQHFLDSIAGQTVLYGRRSHEIFSGEMRADHVVVVSRSQSQIDGAVVCDNFDDALQTACSFGKTVFSCGGASIYELSIPHADEMHLSTIKGNYEGETYFPEFDKSQWHAAEREHHPKWDFVRWVRK